jgi:opacity protein-like surface antigen
MRKGFWLTVLVCIGLTDAKAQMLSDLRLGVFAGGSFMAANRTFAVDGDIFNTKYESGPRFGFRATGSLSDRISLEGAYSFGRNNLRVTTMRAIPVMRMFETRTHQFSGNALYYLSGLGEGWKPFVTAGIGITRFSPTQEAAAFASVRFLDDPASIQSSNKFGINFGGGTEYKPSDTFGLRFDFRDHVMGVPRFSLPQTSTGPGGVFYPVSGKANNAEVTAGVVFYLP